MAVLPVVKRGGSPHRATYETKPKTSATPRPQKRSHPYRERFSPAAKSGSRPTQIECLKPVSRSLIRFFLLRKLERAIHTRASIKSSVGRRRRRRCSSPLLLRASWAQPHEQRLKFGC